MFVLGPFSPLRLTVLGVAGVLDSKSFTLVVPPSAIAGEDAGREAPFGGSTLKLEMLEDTGVAGVSECLTESFFFLFAEKLRVRKLGIISAE